MDLFGSLYDLNGDGKTDFSEAALMFMIYNEMTKDDEEQDRETAKKNRVIDLDDLDIEGI